MSLFIIYPVSVVNGSDPSRFRERDGRQMNRVLRKELLHVHQTVLLLLAVAQIADLTDCRRTYSTEFLSFLEVGVRRRCITRDRGSKLQYIAHKLIQPESNFPGHYGFSSAEKLSAGCGDSV